MKITVHPLFYIALVLSAVFGGLTSMLICLVTALLHEGGHIFLAARMGFDCKEVKIMPYGAAAVCDIEGISLKDELVLAIAGPSVNAAICVICAALWWFVPESYAYTDTVMNASLAMLMVNMLPAYPLDGGRAIGCILAKYMPRRKAVVILKISAAICSAGMVAVYFLAVKNFSLLVFGVFLLFSATEKTPQAALINFSSKGIKRGREVKYVVCDGDITFIQSFRFLEDNRYLILRRYSQGGVSGEVTQDELYSLAVSHGIYDKVFSCAKEDED